MFKIYNEIDCLTLQLNGIFTNKCHLSNHTLSYIRFSIRRHHCEFSCLYYFLSKIQVVDTQKNRLSMSSFEYP